jgi:hypothetical protein
MNDGGEKVQPEDCEWQGKRTNEANSAVGAGQQLRWKEMPLSGAPPLGSGQWFRLAARSSFRTESTRISQTRWETVVFSVPTASSRSYSWLRSSPSMATCVPLARVPAKSASFPKVTHRCHSVRDSQSPASFFQDVLVAGEKIAGLVALLSFFSASLPMKPMRAILVEVHTFLLSALLSRAPGSEWARLPRQEVAFSGGTGNGGARTRMVPQAKQKLRRRRAPQKPRSRAETEG